MCDASKNTSPNFEPFTNQTTREYHTPGASRSTSNSKQHFLELISSSTTAVFKTATDLGSSSYKADKYY